MNVQEIWVRQRHRIVVFLICPSFLFNEIGSNLILSFTLILLLFRILVWTFFLNLGIDLHILSICFKGCGSSPSSKGTNKPPASPFSKWGVWVWGGRGGGPGNPWGPGWWGGMSTKIRVDILVYSKIQKRQGFVQSVHFKCFKY